MNKKELCWLITTECNQKCKYCDRFLKNKNLSNYDYIKIINKLSSYGVPSITLGGGEALLVNNINDIVRIANEKNIKLKLVTNGLALMKKKDIIPNFDIITLSIDCIDNDINEYLGRGKEHYSNICNAIDYINSLEVKPEIHINSVANRYNLNLFINTAEFIKKYSIKHWRILRFCPLRETAIKNKNKFEITENEFKKLKAQIENLDLNTKVDFRNYNDMESQYLLISPDGMLCISDNLNDKVIGNLLEDDLFSYFYEE
ncbi:MAG: radical SAM protein [Bacilli bacterium]|nr:radical SAM protein [Bacilli bacterium]